MSGFPTTPEELEKLLNGPAQRPPPNVKPDFNNPGEGNAVGLAVTLACLVLVGICATLRAYSQLIMKKRFIIEDALGFFALLCFCGLVWVNIRMVQLDMFKNHQWNFTFREFSEILFALYLLPTFFTLFMLFAKPAILLEWRRIFVPTGTRNIFWWTCMGLVVANSVFYTVTFVLVQFYCVPHEKIWRRWVPGHCRNRRAIEAPSTVFNLGLDILVLLLPQKVIWTLNMTKRNKIGISIIFSVGLLAVAASAGRVHAAFTMDYTYDVTYDVGATSLWGLAECTCIMLVFCVPTIPKIFKESAIFTKLMTSIRSITVPLFGTSRGTSNSSGSTGSRWRGAILPSSSKAKGTNRTRYKNPMNDDDNTSGVQLTTLEAEPVPPSGNREIVRTTQISSVYHSSNASGQDKSWAHGRTDPWDRPSQNGRQA